jgi:hypothetical protein
MSPAEIQRLYEDGLIEYLTFQRLQSIFVRGNLNFDLPGYGGIAAESKIDWAMAQMQARLDAGSLGENEIWGAAAVVFVAGAMSGDGGGGKGDGFPGNRLPRRVRGDKTSGILKIGEQEIPLTSGRNGPAASMPADAPGMPKEFAVRDHVEAHAAATMRQKAPRMRTCM